MATPVRVLLADHHQLVRQGIVSVLERERFQVVGEAGNGVEAVRMVRAIHPDVAVLAMGMPLMNGIDCACEILAIAPSTGIVLLTAHADEHYVVSALRAGIRGYVLKSEGVEDVIRAIQEVSAGGMYLSAYASRVVLDGFCSHDSMPIDPLSSKERQILQLIAEGRSTKEVAQLLNLTVKSAESHRVRLMRKLNIHDTANLVRYAVRRGLVHLCVFGAVVRLF